MGNLLNKSNKLKKPEKASKVIFSPGLDNSLLVENQKEYIKNKEKEILDLNDKNLKKLEKLEKDIFELDKLVERINNFKKKSDKKIIKKITKKNDEFNDWVENEIKNINDVKFKIDENHIKLKNKKIEKLRFKMH